MCVCVCVCARACECVCVVSYHTHALTRMDCAEGGGVLGARGPISGGSREVHDH